MTPWGGGGGAVIGAHCKVSANTANRIYITDSGEIRNRCLCVRTMQDRSFTHIIGPKRVKIKHTRLLCHEVTVRAIAQRWGLQDMTNGVAVLTYLLPYLAT